LEVYSCRMVRKSGQIEIEIQRAVEVHRDKDNLGNIRSYRSEMQRERSNFAFLFRKLSGKMRRDLSEKLLYAR
jgi:hypothetical protein